MTRNVVKHPTGQNNNDTHRNVVEYYGRCVPKFEEWRNKTGQLHRTDGPAYTGYDSDGTLQFEEWYKNGKQTTPPDTPGR